MCAAFRAPMPCTSASVAASAVTMRSIEPKWARSRCASAGPTPGSPCSRKSRLDARRFGFRSNRRRTRSRGPRTCSARNRSMRADCSGSDECSTGIRHIACDGHECAFDRVMVHVRQRRRRRTFDQQQRSVGTMSESRHLRKQATIEERGREIADGLSLDERFAVHQVIARSQTVHLHVEPAAPAHRVHQGRRGARSGRRRADERTRARCPTCGARSSPLLVLRASMTDSGRRCHRRQRRIKRKGLAIQASSSSFSRSGPPTTSILSLTNARSVKPSKDINIRPT
jgi:hypothetical protein